MTEVLGVLTFGFVVSALFAVRTIVRPLSSKKLGVLINPSRRYEEEPVPVDAPAEGDREAPSTGVPFLARLELDARKAGLNIPGRHFLLVALVAGAGAFTAAYALVNSLYLAGAVSLVGVAAPRWWLAQQKRKRAVLFAKHLDGALQIAANSMRAGASLSQALGRVAEDAPDPVGAEFRKVDKAIQLGVVPAEALAAARERVESPELDLVIVATRILSQTGGNLAEIYDSIAQTVRDRRNFGQAVRAYTAQARMSAAVISIMPVVLTLFMRALNPRYFDPLLETVAGKIVAVISASMIAVGWFVIRRMIDIAAE